MNKTVRTGDRGIILMEMAIILPLLLLLSFAVIEYGWAFMKQGEVVNAARYGARLGVVPDATNNEVSDAVTTLMDRAGLGSSGYQVTIDPDVTTLGPGQRLSVKITVPYQNIAITGLPFIPTPAQLSAEVSMAKEGP